MACGVPGLRALRRLTVAPPTAPTEEDHIARLYAANKTGTHTADITERDDGYVWACGCGDLGYSRRRDDAIEYAGQHVDTHN